MGGDGVVASPEGPARLFAGPVEVSLERGGLRSIRMADTVLLSGIYAAVRDRGWGTVEPSFSRHDIVHGPDGFTVSLDAACTRVTDTVDIGWTATIVGRPDGSISFSFDALVRRPFLRARIGLCVLHPQRLAGTPVAVETPWGLLRGRFPSLITAHLPFSNITRIRQDLGKISELEIRFEGDLFQMEDQRAFTEPSFKTFSPPLELPWPVMLEAGTRIHQAVHLRPVARPGRRKAARATRRATTDVVALEIGVARRPRPRIGTEVPPAEVDIDDVTAAAVQALRLDFLRTVVDGSDPAPGTRWATALASRLGLPMTLGVVARVGDGGVAKVVRSAADSRVPLERISAFDPLRHTTPPRLLEDVRDALAAEGLRVPAGGGSRGYVYQLVLDGVAPQADFVEYAINPQVHATDPGSILETVDSLAATVATARDLGGGAPVHVAPVSMKPLFNPDRVGPEPDPGPGGLPDRYDRRQGDVLTAIWTLASLAVLASEGVASVSVHEAAGWAGLVEATCRELPRMPHRPGFTLPVGRVVAAITEPTQARLCTTSTRSAIAALALEHDRGWRILIASRERVSRQMIVELPLAPARIEATLLTADAIEPWQPTDLARRGRTAATLVLPAWSVVRIDAD
jgi:hypothetical protein